MNEGLVTKIFSWGTSPTFSEGTILDWIIGLVFIMMISLLWAQVVNQITD
jgi:hypothetical protein